jgi:hypothetical protein
VHPAAGIAVPVGYGRFENIEIFLMGLTPREGDPQEDRRVPKSMLGKVVLQS